jgi:hypothetical protein
MKYNIAISTILFCLSGAFLLAQPGFAAEITGMQIDDQPKKITLTYTADVAINAEAVYEYVKNVIIIKVSGLQLSKAQKRGTHLKGEGVTEKFYRNTLLRDMEGGAEIVIVLGKLSTPADAQVIPLDNKVVVEIVKPLWKLEQEPAAADTAGSDAAVGDEPAADDSAAPADSGSEPADGTASADSGSVSGWDDAAGDNGGDAATADGTEPPANDSFIPDQSYVAQPSYRQFDLSKVPVEQVEILGQPFDEAIVTLVSSTGFNVLVGEGIDETEVNLNFTGREVSLKGALDLLCLAYNLQYSVEDDAIIVTLK